jgi:hypothetical protein
MDLLSPFNGNGFRHSYFQSVKLEEQGKDHRPRDLYTVEGGSI